MSHFHVIKLCSETYESPEGSNEELTPIIFMHGMMCSKEYWENIPQVIADKTKRKVYSYDARNHGESEYKGKVNFDLNTDDLFFFMDQNKINKAILVGHSMGGQTAIIAALREPERVEKIFPVDIFFKTIPQELCDMIAFYTTLRTNTVRSLPKDLSEKEVQKQTVELMFEKIPEDTRKQFESEKESMMRTKFLFKRTPDGGYDVAANSDALVESAKEPKNLMNDLTGQYQGPAFFLYGNLSRLPVKTQEAGIKEHFPNAKLIAFEGASHNVPVEFPEKFIKTILDNL